MRRTSLVVLATQLLPAVHAQTPYIMNWSPHFYGPDGPWQAVTIAVGSNNQQIALYPGANYASTILADSICANSTLSSTCYAARAGTYNQSESATSISPDRNSSSSWNVFYWSVQGGSIQGTIGDEVTLGETVIPNVSFTTIYDTYQTYPNGRSYPVSVGNLALGAPRLRQTSSGLSLNMIAAWLYISNQIPSYSYSMHIGSVDPPIAGSLVLGGYDRTRLIGQASSQSVVDTAGILQIVLRDIGLGVAEGGSPFPSFTTSHRGGLFLDDEYQNGGVVLPRLVTIDPTKPYMYLPEATCNAITAFFPVSFDTGFGLYIWDTNSADYTTLTSSPTYLSFTFNKGGSTTQNITVRVPLQLLTLTLQEPLVEGQNLTYFPCFLSADTPVLGRAFLQAAFMGVNWFEGENNGTWFLGQAPGPTLPGGEDIAPIAVVDTTLRGSEEGSWAESWTRHWTPLEINDQTSNSNTTDTSDSSGLSTGAKAGIGVGAGISGVILAAVGVYATILRRRKQTTKTHEKDTPVIAANTCGQAFTELPAGNMKGGPMELASKGTTQPREIMETERVREYELE
ncbi:aspartic peptidase domain-containing protein [Aspergillus cavernicola]|uniref:Aspartic peptidase domain-containing protein n=1 Tax=Aspergillus cavernicola TaxID=176166 RepID=A0ABR4IYU9_9EURO